MKIIEHQPLKSLNTFGIAANAAYFVEAHSEEELRQAFQLNIQPILILGGGSNLLLTKDFDGLVIKNTISGKEIIETKQEDTLVRAGAGENWHLFVLWCLEQGLGGIENLSLIPGTIGAAPIQNIGAYGVELKDVFHHLEAMHIASGDIRTFSKEECRFGYRDSIFKQELKGQYCITQVYLRLNKSNNHDINISYGAIRDILQTMNIKYPTIHDISKAVITIRSSKLPDPVKIGNSGSFFKNPEIPLHQFEALQKQFPTIISFPGSDGNIKIPAGWLIEQCGWKGYRRGDAGCYEKQALVLVNYGNAKGLELWQLAQDIADSVEAKFGIRLHPEVNVI
ncbi:MAG: UDP-N-acetylmuramate dehydrogenase [Saprospiraceae bacterium]|nr:UDP-N-acetylmuramate dehydrogenase [Saprospiraceae bacterium]